MVGIDSLDIFKIGGDVSGCYPNRGTLLMHHATAPSAEIMDIITWSSRFLNF